MFQTVKRIIRWCGEFRGNQWAGRSLFVIAVLVLLWFLFSYLQARFQEAISFELVTRDQLAIGEALKLVSLGYFQQVDTGNILMPDVGRGPEWRRRL